MAFSFKEAPLGWLACDGRYHLKEDYPLLFKTIGTTFGENGAYFKVPDLQGQFIRGWDGFGNTDPERAFGSPQRDAFQGHSHEVRLDPYAIRTSEDGEHSHYLKGLEHEVGSWGRAISTWDYSYSPDVYRGGTTDDGKHSHRVLFDEGAVEIHKPRNYTYGTVRVDVETRPTNVALLYCIKAEDAPSPKDIEDRIGLSTLIEKTQDRVLNSLTPLYESLPVEKIGSEQYQQNIEIIKSHHFEGTITDIRDIEFRAARCFRDICLYNCRLGQRLDSFDEFGLSILVCWMVDKGFVEDHGKSKFIQAVKSLLASIQASMTPSR